MPGGNGHNVHRWEPRPVPNRLREEMRRRVLAYESRRHVSPDHQGIAEMLEQAQRVRELEERIAQRQRNRRLGLAFTAGGAVGAAIGIGGLLAGSISQWPWTHGLGFLCVLVLSLVVGMAGCDLLWPVDKGKQ